MIVNIYFALIVAGPIEGGPGMIHSIWPNISACMDVVATMDPKEVGGCVPVTAEDPSTATEQLKLLHQLLYAENEKQPAIK